MTVGRLVALSGLMALWLSGCASSTPKSSNVNASPSTSASSIAVGNTMHLSPSSGPPGTTVTIHGYISPMRQASVSSNGKHRFGGNIGFGGFRLGLNISANTIHWSSTNPGHFTTQFQVPKTAWLTAKGTRLLKNGVYRVAIDCFGNAPVRGCAVGPNQAQATFSVTHVRSQGHRAPFLRLSPATAKPGQTVKVSGWAPLTNVIGHPFGYELTLTQNGHTTGYGAIGHIAQTSSGNVSGSFIVPSRVGSVTVGAGSAKVGLQYVFLGRAATAGSASNAKGLVDSLVAKTALRVMGPLTWTHLAVTPQQIFSNAQGLVVNGNTVVASDLRSGGLWISHSGGGTWNGQSLVSIEPEASSEGYPAWLGGSPHVSVQSVALAPGFPSSLFVTIAAIKHQYGSAPPIFYTPYQSTDGGQTWHPIPVPKGFNSGDFAGFLTSGSRVYAQWMTAGHVVTEYTADGGATWAVGQLGCPSVAPCLSFGPYSDQYPGMGVGITQPILRQNSHKRWVTSTNVLAPVSMQTATQLVTLGSHQALLIDPTSPYPVRLTTNQGKTWQYVELPKMKTDTMSQLMMLSDGHLLAEFQQTNGSTVGWFVLAPGQSTWKAISSSVLPSDASHVTPIGRNIWWRQNTSQRQGASSTPRIHVTPERNL